MFSRVSVFSRSAVCRVARVARPLAPVAARAVPVSTATRSVSSVVSRPRLPLAALRPRVARFSTSQNVLASRVTSSERKTEQQSFNSRWSTGAKLLAGFAVAAGVSVITAAADSKVDYDAVRKDIAALLEAENYDDGSYGPLFVRLAWHAAGTYDKASNTGGSDGATMRFKPESSDGANAGLALARDLLEKVKAKHPGITYADLWTLAGATAIEEMGGPKIPWRAGRSDKKESDPVPPNGRLPDASKKADHVRAVFYRMGFNDREIVALLGAHALGRCHTDRSGYEGPWTNAPTTFSNEYFRLLLEEKWTPRKWNGPLQFQDSTGKLMMTPADLAFIEDPEFRKVVEEYAKDEGVFFKDFAAAFGKLLELGVPFK